MDGKSYLFVVNYKRDSDFGSSGPFRVERIFSVTDKISREVIMVIPFEFLDLGSIRRKVVGCRHFVSDQKTV